MRKRKLKVKVIGCGGIGTCLLPILGRYLNFERSFVPEMTLIDGDDYEEANRTRQTFEMRGNKAIVTAEAMKEKFENLTITPVMDFLNEANIKMHIKSGDVVFCCVDNHATRKLVSDRCEKLQNVLLISGGNQYTDGDIQVHLREHGEDITPPITRTQRDIANPTDEIPTLASVFGCHKQHASAPQLLIMNNMVAALMLNAFYGWKEGTFSDHRKYSTVYTDILVNKSNPVKRS